MKTKECPSCAMKVDASEKECPICAYEFAERNATNKWIAILLIVIMLIFLFL